MLSSRWEYAISSSPPNNSSAWWQTHISKSGHRNCARNVGQAVGTTYDPILFGGEVARAREEGLVGLAAVWLGRASQALSYTDPVTAVELATEGLALARETGMPVAIVHNLLGLAQALA